MDYFPITPSEEEKRYLKDKSCYFCDDDKNANVNSYGFAAKNELRESLLDEYVEYLKKANQFLIEKQKERINETNI